MGRRRRRKGRRRKRSLPANLTGARRLARQRFKIRKLRSEQEEAIEAVLDGRDALVVLPTGYGKSLVYQLAALLLDRPTVVVTPLIALARDQERALRAARAPVVRLDSTLKVTTRRQNLARLRKGGRLVVLTTPETLAKEDASEALMEANPKLLCVDEAHCITEWGHDFRPAYLRVAAEARHLGVDQILALTATATERVRDDIRERLDLDDPLVITAPPHRANLAMKVQWAQGSSKMEVLGKLLRKLKRPGIVYASTIRSVNEIFAALRRAQLPCERYHGKLGKAERQRASRNFMKKSRRSVMVATSAFGMGIDKPNIRYVIHVHAPASLEQYVQEAGRAGRDGRRSRCILLYDPEDRRIAEHLLASGRATPAQLRRVTEALAAWISEERPVSAKDLATSAGVGVTAVRSALAELEQLGLIERGSDRRFHGLCTPRELQRSVKQLVKQLTTRDIEDARRLDAMAGYADSEECRSVFIRRYFGEEDPPACGICDRCRDA